MFETKAVHNEEMGLGGSLYVRMSYFLFYVMVDDAGVPRGLADNSIKSCPTTSFSLVVCLADTTFLSSSFVSKICVCTRIQGDAPIIK